MNTEDIKVGGFYLWTYSNRIEYVTKVTDNLVHYKAYKIYTGSKMVSCCDRQAYTYTTRPISPAEIFLRFGNEPKVVKWVKEMREK